MFPLRDVVRTKKFPLATFLILGLNVYVFFLELALPDPEAFIEKYSLIPARVDFNNITSLLAFVTSQFLHAGFLHIVSNMWFLKIFGDNVEEKFGSLFYLFVYLLSGVVGGFVQYLFVSDSSIPMMGASASVAGILGAYFVFFPHHFIETLVPVGFFMTTIRIPASVMLGYWFLIQIFSGFGSIVVAQVGGVAWWAHVGGFATGWIIARFYKDFYEGKEKDREIWDI